MDIKFIELHDMDNVSYMINTAWIMFYYGIEDGGCVLWLGIPNSNGGSMVRSFRESYETIKEMLDA